MKAGQEINLRYAEVKYPDLPRYAGNEGMIMLENIRAAMAQDKYITKGGMKRLPRDLPIMDTASLRLWA